MTPDKSDDAPRPARKVMVQIALGLLGGVIGATVAWSTRDIDLAWSDEVAMVVAVALLGAGVISGFIVALRPNSMPKGCGVLQVSVLLLAGAMLLAPMVVPSSLLPPLFLFVGIVGLFAVQSVLNVRLWFVADEMLRKVMLEASALAFWPLQGAFFLYAAAERLQLVEPVSAWGLFAILMAIYLIASTVAGMRRGLS